VRPQTITEHHAIVDAIAAGDAAAAHAAMTDHITRIRDAALAVTTARRPARPAPPADAA
jgi:DNA-binding GntR family transcriptional regulator